MRQGKQDKARQVGEARYRGPFFSKKGRDPAVSRGVSEEECNEMALPQAVNRHPRQRREDPQGHAKAESRSGAETRGVTQSKAGEARQSRGTRQARQGKASG